MARSITYNGYNLQGGNINVMEIQQIESSMHNLNLQRFAGRDGGKIISTAFEPKKIVVKGKIYGSSQADLDDRMDTFKKQMQTPTEADLVIGYLSGTRRFIATCSAVSFDRKYYNIDAIDYEAEFLISNPPFGKDTAYTTINFYNKTNTFAATTTGVHDGTSDFAGTVVPRPRIIVTFNMCSSVEGFTFRLSNGEGFITNTKVTRHFNSGDILIIDNEAGTIQLNGTDVDFTGGFPRWTLDDNSYSVKIRGRVYDVDVQFVYYKLWL